VDLTDQSSVGFSHDRVAHASSSVPGRRPEDRSDASDDWNGSFRVIDRTGPTVSKVGVPNDDDDSALHVHVPVAKIHEVKMRQEEARDMRPIRRSREGGMVGTCVCRVLPIRLPVFFGVHYYCPKKSEPHDGSATEGTAAREQF